MSDRWFRLYESVLNDPKLQRLPGEIFKGLINLWCLASAHNGVLPALADIAFALRLSESKADALLSTLKEDGLLDEAETGLRPHNWDGRQFTAEQRQQYRHRDKRQSLGLPRNRWVNPKIRQSIFERDGHACVHCGSSENLTIDHIVSELKGGTNEPSNLQTLCRSCNARKREFPDEYAREAHSTSGPHKPLVSTDTDTEQRQNSVTNVTGAEAPLVDPEKELFDRGKQVLGKNAGGQISKLIRAKGGSIPLARAAIEQASTKQNPGEYIGAILRGRLPPDPNEAQMRVAL